MALGTCLKNKADKPKPSGVLTSPIFIQVGFCLFDKIMDLFSRKIIAWRLSGSLEAKWVVECVLEAKRLRRTTQPLVLHSDRGSQYVSGTYIKALNNIMPTALKSKILTTPIDLFSNT